MTKLAPGIALGEIQTAIGELNAITSIMRRIGENVPDDDVRGDWLVVLGRAIEQVTQHIERVMEQVP